MLISRYGHCRKGVRVCTQELPPGAPVLLLWQTGTGCSPVFLTPYMLLRMLTFARIHAVRLSPHRCDRLQLPPLFFYTPSTPAAAVQLALGSHRAVKRAGSHGLLAMTGPGMACMLLADKQAQAVTAAVRYCCCTLWWKSCCAAAECVGVRGSHVCLLQQRLGSLSPLSFCAASRQLHPPTSADTYATHSTDMQTRTPHSSRCGELTQVHTQQHPQQPHPIQPSTAQMLCRYCARLPPRSHSCARVFVGS